MTGLWDGRLGNLGWIRSREKISIYSKSSRPILVPTQPPVLWVPGAERPGRGVEHPPTSNVEVKERVELYIYSRSVPSRPVLGRPLPYMPPWHGQGELYFCTALFVDVAGGSCTDSGYGMMQSGV